MVKNIKHYRFERNYDIEVSKIILNNYNINTINSLSL